MGLSHNNEVIIMQSVAILVDGNNIERSIHKRCGNEGAMLNFDTLIPKLIVNRSLNRLIYFREGRKISHKLAERLHQNYHGSVRPCHKSADIPLSIHAIQLASKVDTIIIMSGDSDYIELVHHLKSEGVRVEIAAVRETTSSLLKEEADYFHPIVEEDWFILGGRRPMGRGGKFKRHPREGFKTRHGEASADVEVEQDHDEDREE
jgi:uncharacterized LabA/DUF88 family protein